MPVSGCRRHEDFTAHLARSVSKSGRVCLVQQGVLRILSRRCVPALRESPAIRKLIRTLRRRMWRIPIKQSIPRSTCIRDSHNIKTKNHLIAPQFFKNAMARDGSHETPELNQQASAPDPSKLLSIFGMWSAGMAWRRLRFAFGPLICKS